jgi:hypothetical protein
MLDSLVMLVRALGKEALKAIQNGRTKAVWARVAALEGLRFQPGGLAGGAPRMSGVVDGRSVRVDTYQMQRSEATPQVWTRYKVDLPGALPRGLRIEPVAPLPGLFQPAIGIPEVQTGDAAFQRHVKVFADDPEELDAWLTARRRERLRQVFALRHGVRISREGGLRFDQRGFEEVASRLSRTLHELAALANDLGAGDERGEPGAARVEPRVPAGQASWADVAGGAGAQPTPEPEPTPEPTPEPMPEPMPEPEVAAAPASPDLDAGIVALELFGESRPGFETTRLFDERYAGRDARATGTVERVEAYSSDLAFGAGPGLKVRLALPALLGEGFGRDAHVALALPPALEADLRARRGERLAARGRLVKCDPFLRTLYLAEGSVLAPAPPA